MVPRIGLIGRGYWGNTWAEILKGTTHWQAGKDWEACAKPERVIVATSTDSHYEVAMRVVSKWAVPVLVEKPACLRRYQAINLMCQKVPVWVNHTRLFDPAWEAFRNTQPNSVEAWAGGANETNPDAYLNWISHLVPMCLDAGTDPAKAKFHITQEKQPLRFVADGREFRDTGGALKNLLGKFLVAEKSFGLDYALAVAQYLEKR